VASSFLTIQPPEELHIKGLKPTNSMMSKEDNPLRMQTLSEITNDAFARGYTENFKVVASGLSTADGKMTYNPQHITISDFYRFEGLSDPQDNSILYIIETNDGKKGTLIDIYGPDADAKISSFIRQVDVIQKG
jgi:hypothetical protein